MALVHPAISTMPHPLGAGEQAERELIRLLVTAFSGNYAVFHNIDWSREGKRQQILLGELDAVLVNGNGDMAVIELKSGKLEIIGGVLHKDYGQQRKDVMRQFAHQRTAMRARLNEAGLNDVKALHLLALPDFQVRNPSELIGLSAEELVDARAYPHLVERLRRHLPECAVSSRGESVRHFLMNVLDIVPDIDFQKARLGEVTRQLADGLATWVPRIAAPKGLYVINATAGCGKTQMSLDLLNKASASGLKTLYLCYNRPLADRMRNYFSPKVMVCNYDDLCMEHYRRHVGEPDFKADGIFQTVQDEFRKCTFDAFLGFDILIVDEAQDFRPEWIQHLLDTRLRDAGLAYILQDEEQRIYPRPSFSTELAVIIHCDDNFRSPQNIVSFIRQLNLTGRKIRARSALVSGELVMSTYTDEGSLFKHTAAMIDHFLQAGYKPDDILVATGRGKDNSVLLQADAVGQHSLRRPTGTYDTNHEPVWTSGSIQADSIYRTKGQSAPVVILTEMDFETIDEKTARLLFVGLTRASMGVGLVFSERARRAVEERLNE